MVNIHGGDIYKHKNKNLIDFSANINPLGLPRGVRMALMDSIDLTVHYPDVQCNELREGIAQKYGIEKEYILCGNGAADLIFALTQALKPKKTLVLAPTFAEYEQALSAAGSKIYCYRLKKEFGFALQEDFLNTITSDMDMVFLCNPNNPTGEVIPKPLLIKIIQVCHKNHTILVLDECFNSFLDEPEKESVLNEINQYDNLIIMNAFTKLYAMPGVRLGYAIVKNKQILKRIQTNLQPWNVSLLAQQAGVAALKEDDYVAKTKELIQTERKYLIQELTKLGYQIYGSKANYIFFQGEKGLVDTCLAKDILIRDCSNYRGLEEGYYRVAVRTHEENQKLVDALRTKE